MAVSECSDDPRLRRPVLLLYFWLAALAAGTLWWVADFVPPSADLLDERGEDLPGVDQVVVEDPDGDDVVPFDRVQRAVTVVLADKATPDEIAAVFRTYADDIHDGDVGFLVVRFHQTKALLRSTGMVVDPEGTARDLREAQDDPGVCRYVTDGQSAQVLRVP